MKKCAPKCYIATDWPILRSLFPRHQVNLQLALEGRPDIDSKWFKRSFLLVFASFLRGPTINHYSVVSRTRVDYHPFPQNGKRHTYMSAYTYTYISLKTCFLFLHMYMCEYFIVRLQSGPNAPIFACCDRTKSVLRKPILTHIPRTGFELNLPMDSVNFESSDLDTACMLKRSQIAHLITVRDPPPVKFVLTYDIDLKPLVLGF